MSKWLPTTGLLLAALLLCSCQRSGRPPAPPSPAPRSISSSPAASGSGSAAAGAAAAAARPAAGVPAAAGGPVSAGAAAASPGARGPARPAPGAAAPPAGIALQPQPAALSSRGLASASTLAALGRDGRVLPEDFEIGPLGDDRGDQPDQDQAMAAAGRFLTALVAGKVDRDLIAEASRDTMAGTLTFGLENGGTPTSWRMGKPRTRDDGEVSAAVRLLGRDGSSAGEIYLARSGSSWRVADLQLSLAELSVKSEKPKEKFFPLEYRWLLEE